jgi:nucleoid-associated protein YgaU
MRCERLLPTQFYTVVKGDTLSKISKQYYGDANA